MPRALYESLKLGSKYTPAYVPQALAIGGARGCARTGPLAAAATARACARCRHTNQLGERGLRRVASACRARSCDAVGASTVFRYSPFRHVVDRAATRDSHRPLVELWAAAAALEIPLELCEDDESLGVRLHVAVLRMYDAMARSPLRMPRRAAARFFGGEGAPFFGGEGAPFVGGEECVLGIPAPVPIGAVRTGSDDAADRLFDAERCACESGAQSGRADDA